MAKLVCEKCGNDDVRVICHPIRTDRTFGWFLIFFIPAVVFMVVAFIYLIKAYQLINEEFTISSTEDFIYALRQLSDNFEDILIVPIGAILFSLMSIMTFMIVLSFRIFADDSIKSQVIAVCPHCGKSWIIPVNLREFDEEEVYQARMKRKELLQDKTEQIEELDQNE